MLDTPYSFAARQQARYMADPLRCNKRMTIRRYDRPLDLLTAIREVTDELAQLVDRLCAERVGELESKLGALQDSLTDASNNAHEAAELEYERELNEDSDPRDERPLGPGSYVAGA